MTRPLARARKAPRRDDGVLIERRAAKVRAHRARLAQMRERDHADDMRRVKK